MGSILLNSPLRALVQMHGGREAVYASAILERKKVVDYTKAGARASLVLMSLIHLPEVPELVQESGWLLLDTRSPSSTSGPIPGAIKPPAAQRRTPPPWRPAYKQQARTAVCWGFELVGLPSRALSKQVRELTRKPRNFAVLLEGSMRSRYHGLVLELAGYRVHVLKGGYKDYRARVKEQLATPCPAGPGWAYRRPGRPSSSRPWQPRARQVIDLEALANHKGSAFGGLGQSPSLPTNSSEHLLAGRIGKLDPARRVWIENKAMAASAA